MQRKEFDDLDARGYFDDPETLRICVALADSSGMTDAMLTVAVLDRERKELEKLDVFDPRRRRLRDLPAERNRAYMKAYGRKEITA